jgi:hypothetical protein
MALTSKGLLDQFTSYYLLETLCVINCSTRGSVTEDARSFGFDGFADRGTTYSLLCHNVSPSGKVRIRVYELWR